MKAYLQKVTFVLTFQLTLILAGVEMCALLLYSLVQGCFSTTVFSWPVLSVLFGDVCISYCAAKLILLKILNEDEECKKQ